MFQRYDVIRSVIIIHFSRFNNDLKSCHSGRKVIIGYLKIEGHYTHYALLSFKGDHCLYGLFLSNIKLMYHFNS